MCVELDDDRRLLFRIGLNLGEVIVACTAIIDARPVPKKAPCLVQGPTVDRIATELRGRIKVGRLSVYESPATPAEFEIKGIPHLMVVRDGEVILDLVGTYSLEQLRYRLRSEGVV